MPRFSRLRALAAATLAALVIATIQPPAPGAAETSSPTPPTASVAPAAIVAPTPVAPTPAPTTVPTPTPAAAPASPIAVAPPTPAPATPAATASTATTDVAVQAPAAAAGKRVRTAPRANRVIAAAMAERGRPWVFGATGPRAFDCSGLVIYAFRRSGVLAEIGRGRYRSGGAMLRWARAHHLTRTIGHRGDVVVWGNGAHVGIYLGKGRAISTLTSGVRVHGLRVLSTRFTTFISTGLWMPGRGQTVAAIAPVTASASATTSKATTSAAAARGAAGRT